MSRFKDKAIAEGYGLIRAGIVDARRDAAAYGKPAFDGRETRGFDDRPYGYDYATELWLKAYNREYPAAFDARMQTLTEAQRQKLAAQSAENASIRRSGNPAMARELIEVKRRLTALESN
tara:strand:- start:8583 stop:8942 length:360 start_codon:yes stop_codon:yes gene_type:complete